MQGGRRSPLTPAASWAPGGSAPLGSGGGGGSGGVNDDRLPDMQRSKSTFAKLSRSVSRLGSGKASRARQQAAAAAAAAAAPPPPGGQRSGYGGGAHGASQALPPQHRAAARSAGLQDFAASTAARIKLFEEGHFNLESDLGSLTEKGVENLRADLNQLDGEVAQHLKQAVHEHYAEFTRATPGILRLEGEIQQLRNLLLNMGDVVENLKEVSAAMAQSHRHGLSMGGDSHLIDAEAIWRETGDGTKWFECLDDADMAVAERRVVDALSLLRKLEKLLQRFVAGADRQDPAQQARLDSLAAEVEQRREQLITIVEQQILQPIATSADIRGGADLLRSIAGRQHAHSLVLEAYAAKLKRRQASLLRPANSGGSDADGSDYAAALGQKLALCLAAAADDVAAVFGSGGGGGAGSSSRDGGSGGDGEAGAAGAAAGVASAELSAAALVWALHQTERACHLLRKHALLPFAAPAGLHAFSRCAFAFTAHCAALEVSHGLQLVPTVQRELWPVLEQVLARRVRKLGEALRRGVLTEVDQLAQGAVPPPTDLASWGSLVAAFPSADYFLDELEATAIDARRLHSPRLAAAARRAVSDLFQLYTATLAAALNRQLRAPGSSADAKERWTGFDSAVDVGACELAACVEAAMELSTLLLERFVPDALMPLTEVCGQVCSVRALSEHLLRMGEALGMTTVPLTPGGSACEAPALPGPGDAAAAAAEAQQHMAAAAGGQAGHASGTGSTADTEASDRQYRTTTEE